MNAMEQARKRWNAIAKPLHSLGRLEDLIVQIAGVQDTPDVRIDKRCALVFCGDHGVVREGVSQSDSEVTALVAKSIAEGTGNINLMADAAQADVFAVDMGMMTPVPGTIDRRMGAGTANMTEGPAMSREQAEKAVQAGIDLVSDLQKQGYQIAVIGEMGIGNTTAASAIASVLLDMPVEPVTGRGQACPTQDWQEKSRPSNGRSKSTSLTGTTPWTCWRSWGALRSRAWPGHIWVDTGIISPR